jgi:hypothetical protein
VDRITIAELPGFPIGFSGADLEEVWSLNEVWARDLRIAIRRWLEAIRATSNNGALLVVISPGGSNALAAPAIEAYRGLWPWKKVYGATIVDEHTSLRARLRGLLNLYDPLLDGLIVTDNRRDSRAADAGLALLFAATPAARALSDRPADLWNVLRRVFDNRKFATLSVHAATLPISWGGSRLSRTPLTERALVEETARAGIHIVFEDRQLQSVPLAAAGAGNTRFLLTAMPVVAPHLRRCARAVLEDVTPWRTALDPDLLLEFASVTAPVLSGGSTMPAYAALLQPLDAGAEELCEYARGDHPVDPAYCSPPPRGLMRYRPLPMLGSNGAGPAVLPTGKKEASDG